MNLDDFLILDHNGEETLSDRLGKIVAFSCDRCGNPVLASASDNERGSDEEHPSVCRGCGAMYFLDVRWQTEKLYIHKL